MEVENLILTLQASIEASTEKGGDWLHRATRRTINEKRSARNLVDTFISFIEEAKIMHCLQTLSPRRCLTLCIWLAYVSAPLPVALTPFQAFVSAKKDYTTKEKVHCPDIPYFIKDALDPFATPRLTAPILCELCGRGFLDKRALHDHFQDSHGGIQEVRKTIFWHAEQLDALPLSMKRKRTMLANFDQALRCCRPGGTGELEPRRDVACVVCARKGWLDARFPVYLWKTLSKKKAHMHGF